MYVAGAWRFVQCNWGARHLVNAKDAPKPGNRGKSDSLRLVEEFDVTELLLILFKAEYLPSEPYLYADAVKYIFDII